jgi:DNA-binding transcriptional ArsR family regulator
MTALAMKQQGLRPATKVVLYWIADHHNSETGDCFPSINRLATLCEMSRRSVETHITALEDQGLLKRISQYRDTGGKTANSYLLELTGTLENSDDAQNLRMVCKKAAHGDTQNLRMNNLVRRNLGNNNNIYMNTTHKTITEFDQWWDTYPRKVEKYKAATLFPKIRLEVEFDTLIKATKKYAEAVKDKEKKFIPHPTTWLNGRRWNDPVEASEENDMKKALEELGLNYD